MLNNSFVSGNTGGGIVNSGTLTLNYSTVSGNTATKEGGGIVNSMINFNEAGRVTLNNSAVSGNSVTGTGSSGGGIYNNGTVTLNNSTVSGNSVTGTSSSGGGIFIQNYGYLSNYVVPVAEANLTYSTIYDNTANRGGDIAIEDVFADINGNTKTIKQVSKVTIQNSIVANDPTRPSPDIVGTLISLGYNLFVDTSGATFDLATHTQHGTDKTLSVNELTTLFASPVELRDNGGSTKTLALAPDSPAIDQIPLDACHVNGITTDQRGVKRPQGIGCDIGAYEHMAALT